MLSSLRADVGTPDFFRHYIIDNFNDLDINIIYDEELAKEGFNGIHAVGRGAIKGRRPFMAVIKYNGDPTSDEYIGLIGKGITYDTGGLSLKVKPDLMHLDKCGAVNVLSSLEYARNAKLKVNISATVFFAENSIGNSIYYVDDVLELHDGTTVRIGNTDAEGRLGLYDCISYNINNLNVKTILEQSTLTGAALGVMNLDQSPFWCNDEEISRIVRESSLKAFEPMWLMPNTDSADTDIEHSVADIMNIGKNRPYEGATVAAAFLFRALKDKDIKYCHMDIAAASRKGSLLNNAYGNGYGSGTLNFVLDKLAKE